MEVWQLLSGNDVVVNVVLPLILIVLAICAQAVIPKKPNWFMGYRTSMACKNQDTWVFAQKHFGKQMIIFGLVYVLLAIERVMLTDSGASSGAIGVIVAAQVIAVLLALIPTEIALRKTFDKNGERRR